jgi:hypothetical protein
MKWIRKILDRAAEKRPNGLVARFRRWNGGPMTDDELKEMVEKTIEAAKKAKKR